jgi:hypothetical protein
MFTRCASRFATEGASSRRLSARWGFARSAAPDGDSSWPPRAIHRELIQSEDADDFAAWRELGAVMIAASPSDELCRQASEQGVLIFAEVAGTDATAEIRRLRQWPAVGLILLSEKASVPDDAALARNLLFARQSTAADQFSPAGRAHCLLLDADDGELLAAAARAALPIVAFRNCEPSVSLAEARARCDELQAELAGRIEIAGVAVVPPHRSF